MSPEQKRALKFHLAQLSAYYQRPLQDAAIAMYVEDLEDLQFEAVVAALKAYRRDPKSRAMPIPAQIRERVMPVATEDAIAVNAASKIPEAIKKFGWAQPSEAKRFMGELAWTLVQRFGGWQQVCESYGTALNAGMFFAQAREIARSELSLAKSSNQDNLPKLTGSAPRALPTPKDLNSAIEPKHKGRNP